MTVNEAHRLTRRLGYLCNLLRELHEDDLREVSQALRTDGPLAPIFDPTRWLKTAGRVNMRDVGKVVEALREARRAMRAIELP